MGGEERERMKGVKVDLQVEQAGGWEVKEVI